MIPITILLFYSENILLLLGQEKDVAEIAAGFCKILIPGCYAMALFDGTKRFLNAQFISSVPIMVQSFGLIMHIVMCYELVCVMGQK